MKVPSYRLLRVDILKICIKYIENIPCAQNTGTLTWHALPPVRIPNILGFERLEPQEPYPLLCGCTFKHESLALTAASLIPRADVVAYFTPPADQFMGGEDPQRQSFKHESPIEDWPRTLNRFRSKSPRHAPSEIFMFESYPRPAQICHLFA